MTTLLLTLFLATASEKNDAASPLVGLHELGAGNAWDTIAVAPISAQDPIDGMRATVNYFESLADSATTPLLVFLPTHATATWHDGNRDNVLDVLRQIKEDLRPRWVVFTHIGKCETSDQADKAYWREVGWIWSGRARQFCIPKTSATLRAAVTVVEVDSGEVVAESEVEETGERTGPMIQLHAAQEEIRCASSPALHAKAKGQALRQLGSSLAYDVDRLLSTVMFH